VDVYEMVLGLIASVHLNRNCCEKKRDGVVSCIVPKGG
jgi:hypothetical protein